MKKIEESPKNGNQNNGELKNGKYYLKGVLIWLDGKNIWGNSKIGSPTEKEL